MIRLYLDNRTANMVTPQQDFIQVLATNGINYPHNNIQMDTIKGVNYRDFLRTTKKWVKQLSKKADVEPLTENFVLHLGFLDTHNGERIKYYPMALEFADGQLLVGLARQYGEAERTNQLQRGKPIKITKWFLNGEDITKLVYPTKDAILKQNIEIKNIASLINGARGEFNQAQQERIAELTQERDKLLAIRDKFRKYQPKLNKLAMGYKISYDNGTFYLENGEGVMLTTTENEQNFFKELDGILSKAQETQKEKVINTIVPDAQLSTIIKNPNEYKDVIERLRKVLKELPKVGETDGQGIDAVAQLHYFNSNSDYYVTEADLKSGEVFGYAILNGDMQNAELGYNSLTELKKYYELDLYFDRKPLKDIIAEKNKQYGVEDEKDLTSLIELAKQLSPDYTILNDLGVYKLVDESNPVMVKVLHKEDTYEAMKTYLNKQLKKPQNEAKPLLDKVLQAQTIDDLVKPDIEKAVEQLEAMKDKYPEEYKQLNEHLTKVATNG